MLVLSRKPNQKINIGSEITITVVKVRGNVIQLGIDAPRDIRVVRSELKLKIDDSLTAGVPGAGDANGESSDGVAEEVTDDLGPRQNSVTLQRFLQTRSQPATANATNAQPRKTNQPGSDQRSAVPAA